MQMHIIYIFNRSAKSVLLRKNKSPYLAIYSIDWDLLILNFWWKSKKKMKFKFILHIPVYEQITP